MEPTFSKTTKAKKDHAPPESTPDLSLVAGKELGTAAGTPLFLQRSPLPSSKSSNLPAEEELEEPLQQPIQPKLIVSQPGDSDEQEADCVAQAMISSKFVTDSEPCPVYKLGKLCPKCNLEKKLQLQSRSNQTPQISHYLVPSSLFKSSGQPLSDSNQQFFSQYLGYNLSQVRIHTDNHAVKTAKALNAQAYTVGKDIAFGEGKFAPETISGQQLLAHELVHVLQQSRLRPPVESRASYQLSVSPRISAYPMIQRQKDTGTDSIAGDTLEFEGLQLSTNEAIVQTTMETYLKDHTEEDAKKMVSRLVSPLRSDPNLTKAADFADPLIQPTIPAGVAPLGEEIADVASPDHFLRYRIAQTLQRVLDNIQHAKEQFCDEFENTAYGVLGDLLTQSEQQIRAEQMRYGLSPAIPEDTGARGTSGASSEDVSEQQLLNTPDTQGLAVAAAQLAKKLREMSEIEQLIGGETPVLIGAHGASGVEGHSTEMIDRLQTVREEYRQLQLAMKIRFPILAAFSSPEDLAKLDAIAKGAASLESARVIADTTEEKLKNIDLLRQEIPKKSTGKLKIWTLTPVVELTKIAKQVQPNSLQERFIKDRSEPSADTNILELLSFAIGLVALVGLSMGAAAGIGLIATGGELAIAGEAAVEATSLLGLISIPLTLEHIQEYQFQKAASGSHLDQAEAISQENPSLFWLAFDIATTLVSTLDVIRTGRAILNRLAPRVRLYLAASTPEEASKYLDEVEVALANEPIRPKELLKKIEQMKKTPSRESVLAKAEHEVERAEAKAFKQLQKEGMLAERVVGDHHVKVTEEGLLVVCSNHCDLIGNKFTGELVTQESLEKKLEKRLGRASSLANQSAKAKKAGNLQEAEGLWQKALDEAEALIQELEKIRISPKVLKAKRSLAENVDLVIEELGKNRKSGTLKPEEIAQIRTAAQNAEWGVWAIQDPGLRGDVIHVLLGENLPHTTPIIDAVKGSGEIALEVKSIKSHGLHSYLTADPWQTGKLYDLLIQNADKVSKGQFFEMAYEVVEAGEQTTRVLEVALPPNLVSRNTLNLAEIERNAAAMVGNKAEVTRLEAEIAKIKEWHQEMYVAELAAKQLKPPVKIIYKSIQ